MLPLPAARAAPAAPRSGGEEAELKGATPPGEGLCLKGRCSKRAPNRAPPPPGAHPARSGERGVVAARAAAVEALSEGARGGRWAGGSVGRSVKRRWCPVGGGGSGPFTPLGLPACQSPVPSRPRPALCRRAWVSSGRRVGVGMWVEGWFRALPAPAAAASPPGSAGREVFYRAVPKLRLAFRAVSPGSAARRGEREEGSWQRASVGGGG